MISDLPYDLESEILARVPSMSLANLKTTCKRWYALFKDPNFVKKKNNLCKASKEVMLLIHHRVYSINVNRIHNSVDASIEFTGKLTNLDDSKEVELRRIWHCNGLILCYTKDYNSIVVWNPCTGEIKRIKSRSFYLSNDSFAFGCGNSESSCPNYKILRFSTYYCKNSEEIIYDCEIYDFSSDSWRVLDGVTDKWRILIADNVVSLKGNAYWIYFDSEARHKILLSFNFTTEVFVCLPLPDQSEHESLIISVVREEQLAVLHHNIETSLAEITVWLSNKIDEGKEVSWSKFLVVNFDTSSLPCNGRRVMTSWLDKENKVVVSCIKDRDDRDYVYILGGERLHRQVHGESWSWPLLLSYVPSLSHIPKAKREEDTLQMDN